MTERYCDGCSKELLVENLICSEETQSYVESEKNNYVCDDCFLRMYKCQEECSSEDYDYSYMAPDYYDTEEANSYGSW